MSLLREGLNGQRGWQPAWRDAAPKKSYDAIVIGGGGHGLATAYYPAKNHGFTSVALIERGWIGRDIEASVLSRAVRWYAEHRIFENGNKTVVL
jgi:choline dehydrogenase-like flavoprotein